MGLSKRKTTEDGLPIIGKTTDEGLPILKRPVQQTGDAFQKAGQFGVAYKGESPNNSFSAFEDIFKEVKELQDEVDAYNNPDMALHLMGSDEVKRLKDEYNTKLIEANKKKEAFMKTRGAELYRPIQEVVKSGEYKNFFDGETFRADKAIEYFDGIVKQNGGGNYVRDLLVSTLKQAGEYELDEPKRQKLRDEEYRKQGIDIGTYGKQVLDRLTSRQINTIGQLKKESESRAKVKYSEAKETAVKIGAEYQEAVNNLRQLVKTGLLDEQSANQELKELNDNYASTLANLEKDYKASVRDINIKSQNKYARIKKEIEDIGKSITSDQVWTSIPQEIKDKIEKANVAIEDKLLKDKNETRKVVDESISKSVMGGLFTKSFVSGWYRGLNNLGSYLSSKGIDNSFSRYLQSKEYEADLSQTAQYDWSGDEWLKRAVSSTGSSLGTSAPVMIPAIGVTLASGGLGLPAFAGIGATGTLSYHGEKAMNTGEVYRQALDKTGDPNEALKIANSFEEKQAVLMPLYFLEAAGLKNLLTGSFKKALVGQAQEIGQELPTEYWQGYTQEAALTGNNKGFGQYIKDNPETALDTIVATIGQGGIIGGASKIFNTINSAVPSAHKQYLADIINKHGVEFAMENLSHLHNTGVLNDEDFAKAQELALTTANQLQKFEGLGLKGEEAKAYIALFDRARELEEQVSSEQDEAAKALLNEKLSVVKGELAGITKGKGSYAVVTMPGTNGTRAIPISQLEEMDRKGELDGLIKMADNIEIKGDDKLNESFQQRKQLLGNPSGAPKGMYNNEVKVSAADKKFVEGVDAEIEAVVSENETVANQRVGIIDRIFGGKVQKVKASKEKIKQLKETPETWFDDQIKENPERAEELNKEKQRYLQIKQKLNNSGKSVNSLTNDEEYRQKTQVPDGGPQEERGGSDEVYSRIQEVKNRLGEGIRKAESKLQRPLTPEETQDAEKQAAFNHAKEKGVWIDDIYSLGDHGLEGGNENTLVVNEESRVVFKSNNLTNSQNSISALFESIEAHNELFPSTKYDIVGFTGFEKGKDTPHVEVVLSQDFIPSAEQASPQEIEDYMTSLGFEKVNEHTFKNDKYTVSDLRPRNVLKDSNGTIYVIDNVIRAITATKKAQSFGYANEHEALNSVKKRLGKEYSSFGEVTDEDLKTASEERSKNQPDDGDKVKKTVLTTRAYEGTIRPEVKKYLEEKGLYRETVSQEQRSRQATEFINQFGEDAAFEAVRTGDIRGAVAASILSQLVAKNNIEMSGLTALDVDRLDVLGQRAAELIALQDRLAFEGGEFNGQLGYEYENNPDLAYNYEKKVQEFKDLNGGEIPKEIEEKFRQLDTELKEVRKKLAEAEERARVAEEQQAVLSIKESLQREKKKPGNRDTAIKVVQDLRKKIKANNYSDVTGMVAIVDSGLAIIETALKTERYIASAIERGIAHIKAKLKERGIENWDKEEQFRKDVTEEFEQAGIKDKPPGKPLISDRGRLVVPESLIRDLVEQGNDTIETLTAALQEIIKNDLPNITERNIRDAITEYGKTVNPNREEIATKIRQIKRIGRVLSALEDVQAKKRPLRSGVQRDKLDTKERLLNKQLRELMKELPLDEETKFNQQKTLLDAAKTRVQNQIDDLDKQIKDGKKIQKSKRTLEKDEELRGLEEQRDELKKEFEKIFNDEAELLRQRIVNTKLATQKRIEELQRRLREKDFSKPKKKGLIQDSEVIALRSEKLRLQEEFDKEFYKNKLQNRTTRQRVVDFVWDAWGLLRALRATGEFSFMLIQGLVQSTAHPVYAAKALKRALQFFASESKTDTWLREIKSQPWYPELKQSKLALTEVHAELTAREELFYSDWANMIWNILGMPFKLKSQSAYDYWKRASPFKAFERAAVGYLDTLRVMRFLDGKEILETQGVTFEQNPEAYKEMADVINTFTGRASLGPAERFAPELSKVFFSPRNWASMFKQATPYALYHFGKMRAGAEGWQPSVAQKMALADYAKFVGLTTSVVALAAVYLNNDDDEETKVELDPTSSDFGKIKLGQKRIDPWGGRIQQVILTARLLEGSIKDRHGNHIPLGTPNKAPTRQELLIEMATNKLSPSAAILNKYLSSRLKDDGTRVDKYGKDFTLGSEFQENIYPIYWGTVKELLKDDPTALDGLLLFYAFFGGGVNVQERKEAKSDGNGRNNSRSSNRSNNRGD